MDSELLYLKMRVDFHSHMARQATCGEARRAHQAFVRAYLDRVERQSSPPRPDPASTGPAMSNIAKPELVR